MRLRVVLLLTTIVVAIGCQSANDRPSTPSPTSRSVATNAGGSGSMVEVECVERYSLDNLKKRGYAFDGVVRTIVKAQHERDVYAVAFDVKEWFKGGSGTTATRRSATFMSFTSAGGTPHHEGDRLLVTGEEDQIWDCGFTQPYNATVARQWRTTFSPGDSANDVS